MSELQRLGERALDAFTQVHRRVFAGDPAANPRLKVEVVHAATAADTPALVIVTPWTLNGLLFPPGDDFPDTLEIAGRPRPVFVTELAPLGRFRSVNLVGDVSHLTTPARARALALSWAEPLRVAVEAARAGRAAARAADVGREPR